MQKSKFFTCELIALQTGFGSLVCVVSRISALVCVVWRISAAVLARRVLDWTAVAYDPSARILVPKLLAKSAVVRPGVMTCAGNDCFPFCDATLKGL